MESGVEGQVVDPSGGAVSGARVAVSSEGRIAATVFTGDDGQFRLPREPGRYTLTIAADGFAEIRRRLDLAPGSITRVAIELKLAPQSQTVTVVEAGNYRVTGTSSATKTATPLIDVPQAVSVVAQEQVRDQMSMSVGDVVRYVPGVTAVQGENNRDQVVIRGNSSSADFFVNGVRDDAQYLRDLYNVERVEVLKGPNAMIFGRGGGGGVVNRITKEAGPAPLGEVGVQGGRFGHRRFFADFDRPLRDKAAFRLNGLYENSGSFRDFVGLERYGVNPTVSLMPSERARILLSYEHFRDGRTADRGIPSFQGRPADVARSQFFGDPRRSRVRSAANLGSAAIEYQAGRLNIRNRALIGDYDRGYQNYVPGAVSADKTLVALSAYNNATSRRNVFDQTDLTWAASTGAIRHTLLWGMEVGRQLTGSFRQTGFFNDRATSILAPYSDPVVSAPVVFRQSATDADNRVDTYVGAGYVQDQIQLSSHILAVAGVRFDRFDLQFHNHRTGDKLRRIDNLVSPRAGIVVKPVAPLSVYVSYGVSRLPSSGDQFSSLTVVTQQVRPEKFGNYEAGIKWDAGRDLSLTTAVYRLDRTNTRSTDPDDPTRIVQTGSQRTNGYELGVNGSLARKWRVAGGYAYQNAFITSATTAARAGAQAAQTPHHTFSLWNNYRISPRLSAGLGILNRSDMYAAIDNSVTLPGYTRADAALFYSVTEKARLQANVENLLDRRYTLNADGNNNISPGMPRAIRIGLTVGF